MIDQENLHHLRSPSLIHIPPLLFHQQIDCDLEIIYVIMTTELEPVRQTGNGPAGPVPDRTGPVRKFNRPGRNRKFTGTRFSKYLKLFRYFVIKISSLCMKYTEK